MILVWLRVYILCMWLVVVFVYERSLNDIINGKLYMCWQIFVQDSMGERLKSVGIIRCFGGHNSRIDGLEFGWISHCFVTYWQCLLVEMNIVGWEWFWRAGRLCMKSVESKGYCIWVCFVWTSLWNWARLETLIIKVSDIISHDFWDLVLFENEAWCQ